LAGLVWVALRFAHGINASTRFAIWWAVLAAVLILPAAPHIMSRTWEWLKPETMDAARPLYASVPAFPIVEVSPIVSIDHDAVQRWPVYVAAVWGLILLYRLARLAGSYFHVLGVKRRATVSAELLQTRRAADLLLSSEIESPVAVGFARPAVIVPESLS